LVLVVIVAAFANTPAFAEAPSSSFQKLQDASPELLTIQVVDVKTKVLENTPTRKRAHVSATANVIQVFRTKSRTKQGAAISIDYEYSDCQCPSLGPIPILEKGKGYSAYLSKKEAKVFAPAAQSESFVPFLKEDSAPSPADKLFKDGKTTDATTPDL
jgi:hypothetical protein